MDNILYIKSIYQEEKDMLNIKINLYNIVLKIIIKN